VWILREVGDALADRASRRRYPHKEWGMPAVREKKLIDNDSLSTKTRSADQGAGESSRAGVSRLHSPSAEFEHDARVARFVRKKGGPI